MSLIMQKEKCQKKLNLHLVIHMDPIYFMMPYVVTAEIKEIKTSIKEIHSDYNCVITVDYDYI